MDLHVLVVPTLWAFRQSDVHVGFAVFGLTDERSDFQLSHLGVFLYRVENPEFGFGKSIYRPFEFSDPIVRDGNLNRGICDFKGLAVKP